MRVGQQSDQHLFRLAGFLALQLGKSRGGKPIACGHFILEEAEAETFERSRCHDDSGSPLFVAPGSSAVHGMPKSWGVMRSD